MGPDETKAAREELKWNYGEFEIPDVAYNLFGRAKDAGAKAEDQWKKTVQEYESKYPEVKSHYLLWNILLQGLNFLQRFSFKF